MLCARTKSGETVCLPPYTREQIVDMRKKTTYYCPECKEQLIVKVGEEITPHFAHQASSLCSGGGGEGAIHECGKWILYTWLLEQFNDVQLEVFIPDIQQRPDILLSIGDKKIVLEFQYSPISTTLLRKRTMVYQSSGFYPIWILDIRHLQQRSTNRFTLNSFVKQCLFQPAGYSSPVIFFFCSEKKQLTVLQHVLFISLTTAFAQKTIHPLQRTAWPQLFRQKGVQKNVLLTMWKADKKAFRMKRRSASGKQ